MFQFGTSISDWSDWESSYSSSTVLIKVGGGGIWNFLTEGGWKGEWRLVVQWKEKEVRRTDKKNGSENGIHSFHWHVQKRRFLAVFRSFFQSPLLHIFCRHPSPPTILPSSLTSSCHLFLGLPLNLLVPRFIYSTLLGILFSSILCTW